MGQLLKLWSCKVFTDLRLEKVACSWPSWAGVHVWQATRLSKKLQALVPVD